MPAVSVTVKFSGAVCEAIPTTTRLPAGTPPAGTVIEAAVMLPWAWPTLPPKAKPGAVPVEEGDGDGEDVGVLVGDGEGDGEDVAVLVGEGDGDGEDVAVPVWVSSSPWVLPELSVWLPAAVQLPAEAHDTEPTPAPGFDPALAGRGASAAAQVPAVWVSSSPRVLPVLSR